MWKSLLKPPPFSTRMSAATHIGRKRLQLFAALDRRVKMSAAAGPRLIIVSLTAGALYCLVRFGRLCRLGFGNSAGWSLVYCSSACLLFCVLLIARPPLTATTITCVGRIFGNPFQVAPHTRVDTGVSFSSASLAPGHHACITYDMS